MSFWQGAGLEGFDELHAPEMVDHSSGDRGSDRDGFRAGVIELYEAFPDFYAEIEQVLVDAQASAVTVRWSASGTHKGLFLGVPPSGRKVRFSGIEIIKIQADRVVARWGEWDGLDLVQQLALDIECELERGDGQESP